MPCFAVVASYLYPKILAPLILWMVNWFIKRWALEAYIDSYQWEHVLYETNISTNVMKYEKATLVSHTHTEKKLHLEV